jgi:hypothetical protein
MHVAAFALFLALISGAEGQDVPLSTRTLQAGSSQLLEVPSFSFFGGAQSDKDGNLFFHVNAGSYRRPVILKLNRFNGDPTIYSLADEDQKTTIFSGFSVTPAGQVSLLGQTTDGKTQAIRFSSKGTVLERTVLDLPEHISIENFAAFPTGTVLVSAFYLPEAPEGLRGKSFMALFDESGRVKKKFSGELGDVDLATVFQHLREGGATVGADGNLYLLQPDRIVVISESGAVVKRLKFRKPEGFVATKIVVSQNLISIWLLREGAKQQVSSEYLVLDLLTGKRVGLYTPDKELGSSAIAVSFSNQEGFTFFDVENGHVKLTSAPLR